MTETDIEHELFADVPKTSVASHSFYYCQHGIDTRWFHKGVAPCQDCLWLKRSGMKHTWNYPFVQRAPQKELWTGKYEVERKAAA